MPSALNQKRRLRAERKLVLTEVTKRAARRSYFSASNHPLVTLTKLGPYAVAISALIVGIQCYIWLRYGIWPPASPVAIWAYTQPVSPVVFDNATWTSSSNWHAYYTEKLSLIISWAGVLVILDWLLSQHASLYFLGFGIVALLATEELERIRAYRSKLDTTENENLDIIQLVNIERREREGSTFVAISKLFGFLVLSILITLAYIHLLIPK